MIQNLVGLLLYYPDEKTEIPGPYHTGGLPWDLSLVIWEDGTEVLYGGAMTPKRYRKEVWIQMDRDLFGNQIPRDFGWIQGRFFHNYGRRMRCYRYRQFWPSYR